MVWLEPMPVHPSRRQVSSTRAPGRVRRRWPTVLLLGALLGAPAGASASAPAAAAAKPAAGTEAEALLQLAEALATRDAAVGALLDSLLESETGAERQAVSKRLQALTQERDALRDQLRERRRSSTPRFAAPDPFAPPSPAEQAWRRADALERARADLDRRIASSADWFVRATDDEHRASNRKKIIQWRKEKAELTPKIRAAYVEAERLRPASTR